MSLLDGDPGRELIDELLGRKRTTASQRVDKSFKDAQTKAAPRLLKEAEKRIETLKRKAQNNIDRAHNRAVTAMIQKLDELDVKMGLDQYQELKNLYRNKVRHGDEFGKD